MLLRVNCCVLLVSFFLRVMYEACSVFVTGRVSSSWIMPWMVPSPGSHRSVCLQVLFIWVEHLTRLLSLNARSGRGFLLLAHTFWWRSKVSLTPRVLQLGNIPYGFIAIFPVPKRSICRSASKTKLSVLFLFFGNVPFVSTC